MPSKRSEEVRDYAFGDRVLALRKQAGLTQAAWATLLGVSKRTVEGWEAGLTYPGVERLTALIALALDRGLFTPGREEEDAAALWDIPRQRASQRIPPFDAGLFAVLRSQPDGAVPAAPLSPDTAAAWWRDWGEAPAVAIVQGRARELTGLARWIRDERCRAVQILGAGGIGKTTLAVQLAHDLAPEFAAVYWRSLRNALPAEEWLAGAVAALSAGQAAVPDGFEARLGLLLDLLRAERSLLVLDNLETVLEPGVPEVRYRAGLAGYGVALRRLAESGHRGCLLLTSREQPLPADDGDEGAVRALHLEGLGADAGRTLLGRRALAGDDAAWRALIERYGGNPLALSVVGETISAVFGGDVAAFLAQDVAVFGGIRQMLDEQVGRLSALEQEILSLLAVEREPVGFAEVVAGLGPGVPRGDALEAVEALRRRSLLEWGPGGTFTLQPMVLEDRTMRLIAALAGEVLAGEPALLARQPLLKATARDYVRRSQERLIAQPLLERLSGNLGGADAVERRLLELLEGWRGRPAGEQGYGPGNVVNLLRLLRGELRGLDLSGLVIRHVYLQGVEAQDGSLAGAHLSEVILVEAFNYPTAIAFSADGASLAAGTSTGEIFLWRVANRSLLLALQGHTGGIWGLALSADGQLMASASFDGTVKLWDAKGGQPRATLHGHSGGVRDVALSADGRLVASGGEDGTIKLWEASDGQLLATLRGHDHGVRRIALSEDGRLVASGGEDGTVRLWEAAGGGQLLATLQGHSGAARGVALSADGRVVASAGEDGTIKLWDTPGGQPRATLRGHTGPVLDVALSRDGRFVASSSFDGTVKLWETSSGRILTTLSGHTGAIQDLALSADGQLVASGGEDGTVRLWDTESGRLLMTLRGHTGAIPGIAMGGDGRWVASAHQDGTARVWEAGSGRLLAILRGHSGAVQDVALSGDGRLAASGSFDGTVRLWEVGSGRLLATLQGHTSEIRGVALSADGRMVASAGEDGTIKLWDAEGGQPRATLRGHSGAIYTVALSTDGRLAASGSQDATARLWDTESGRLLTTLRGHTGAVVDVAFSGDGRWVASGSQDGTVRLWEAAPAGAPSGRLQTTLRGHISGVWGVALNWDGRLIASGSWDGAIKLWDAPEGRPRATLQGHIGAVRGVALSADGRVVASGSYDGTIKLWDTTSGTLLRTLRPDRPYERLDITGLTGVTEAQRMALHALGAVERASESPRAVQPVPSGLPLPPRPISAPITNPDPMPAPPLVRPPANLPLARTSFVGRTADLAALAQALTPATRIGGRLLTLSGVAGSGKTRLALAVADTVRDLYEDGVWLVELAPLPANPSSGPAAVAAAVSNALGLHEQPGRALTDTLAAGLHAQRLLLILDNCEHVVGASAAFAARLLGACPGLRILATSQVPLGVADEIVWRVGMLAAPAAVPTRPAPAELHRLERSEAIQLFVQRARAVQPGFLLSAENAAVVVAICRQLDGLPLAIELAAARLHVLTVKEVLDRLDDRFRLLRRGGRTAADRHQALQATMDWSYDLLGPAEQALLRRLAVFAGGWEVAAAEAVCAGDLVEAETVLELLDELLERSLVYVQQGGGAPRYGLLETVRQYGVRQMERVGEASAVRDWHLRWCVALAEQGAPALQGAEQALWLARLEREHDNLRAALRWALDRQLGALGVRLAAGLWQFWRSRSYLSEGRQWLAALLALPAEDDDPATLNARASALEGAAWLSEDEHDFADASALFAQGDALRRALGQEDRATGLLINAAMEARARGDYARATALLEESLSQHRAQGNRESIKRGGLGLSLARLALVLAEQGQHARASALYQECLALHRALGDREGIGNALLGLGDVARDLGDTAGVRAYCEETLALFRELGHTWVGFSLNNLALAACLDGDLALAARYAEESAALFRGLHAGPSLAEALVTLGRVRGAQGAVDAARADLAEAITLASEAGPRLVVAAAVDELGVQAARRGNPRQGVRFLSAAARMREAMGTPVRPADRPEMEGALAAARAALGDAAFAEVWAAGQALPEEQIIAQAVADPGQYHPHKPAAKADARTRIPETPAVTPATPATPEAL